MKILQINASYKPAYIYGGPTMSVSKLSEQLVKAGAKVDVFTTTANGISELAVLTNAAVNVDGVRVTYFKRTTKDHSHFSPSLFRKLWHEVSNYDVVHIHAWWNLVSVLSALIVHVRKIPVIISPRGTLSSYSFNNKNSTVKNLFHNLIGKFLLERSHIHVTSNAEKDAIDAIINPKSVFTLPNFVKIATNFDRYIPESMGIFKLLFFSRIEEKKGLNILLSALSKLSIPYQLSIAGDGNEDYIKTLKAIAVENLIVDKVKWIGFQNENKFEILANHDLMILPSHDENFGNVIIESLSVGTPVLISRNVGLASYVEMNKLGWICDPDVLSVKENIDKIYKDHQKDLSQIRKIAPSVILADFDEDRLVHKYMEEYHYIIAHG